MTFSAHARHLTQSPNLAW